MQAYWLDKGESATITPEFLNAQGVLYERLALDPAVHQADLDRVKAANGYIEQDIVELSPDTPNLETICAKFAPEHTHDDDEVRFIHEGAGIFDIRSTDDAWMRVVVEPGDLIVVPKDRNHRFFLTDINHVRCTRLFKDTSGWVPNYREA